jgi:hypothetical protein
VKVLVVSNLYPPDVMGGYELGCRQAVDARPFDRSRMCIGLCG